MSRELQPASSVYSHNLGPHSTLIESELENVSHRGIPVNHQVPLTIISGFLGAGKSTLLKCVPLSPSYTDSERVVVLLGAFSRSNMDTALRSS
jgi:hypothetical protein